MDRQFSKQGDFQPGFKLNMRIIADALERASVEIEFYSQNDSCRLRDVRIAAGDGERPHDYVYLVDEQHAGQVIAGDGQTACIIIGRVDPSMLTGGNTVIQVIDQSDLMEIFTLVQDVFDLYRRWDWNLQRALESERPLDEVLEASIPVFRNPMFIHDTNFYILSCPKIVPGMLEWEIDPRTGRKIVPVSLINDFRVDKEYLDGLSKNQPMIFSAYQRGYPILYRNLWNNGKYEGRVLVDEIQSAIQPGDYYAIDYLGSLLEDHIHRKKLLWMTFERDMERFFSDLLQGKTMDEQQVAGYLQSWGWSRYDRYLCLRITTDQQDYSVVSSSATMGQIEAQLSAGYVFLFDNAIAAIVNLSYTQTSTAEVLSNLATIIREGLLKVGVSPEINDFMLLSGGYRQARIALELGRSGSSMFWCYYFEDYMLEYLIMQGSKGLPTQLICVNALHELQRYDSENSSDLYRTLRVYLRSERSTLQAAKELYIHRSTLSYRLERIRGITGVDLDDAKERLKLMISYYMLEGSL